MKRPKFGTQYLRELESWALKCQLAFFWRLVVFCYNVSSVHTAGGGRIAIFSFGGRTASRTYIQISSQMVAWSAVAPVYASCRSSNSCHGGKDS